MFLKDFQQQFNPQFESLITQKIEKLIGDIHEPTLNPIREYLNAYIHGGKRIRPYMVSLVYNGLGGTDDQLAMHAGIAHELIHLFALVHDDIMDKGTTRHGIATYHTYASTYYAHNDHAGEGQAILVGDFLLQRATRYFLQHIDNKQAQNAFFDMLEDVVIGQSLDIHLSHIPFIDDETTLTTKDTLKTASYTFTYPMLVGAALAGREDTHKIQKIGDCVGIAYQMRDDLMDMLDQHGNKTSYSDLQEGNQTILFHQLRQKLTLPEVNEFDGYRGRELSNQEKTRVRTLIEQSGVLPQAKATINTKLDEAQAMIHQTFTGSTVKEWDWLIEYLRV